MDLPHAEVVAGNVADVGDAVDVVGAAGAVAGSSQGRAAPAAAAYRAAAARPRGIRRHTPGNGTPRLNRTLCNS